MLANFFEVSNQPIYHITTLKIMLRLNNGVRDKANEVDSGCLLKKKFFFLCYVYSFMCLIYKILKFFIIDSVQTLIQIGQAYLNLGYNEKADLAFSQAKSILDSNRCIDEKVKLKWMLGYSYYLCMIGEVDKR